MSRNGSGTYVLPAGQPVATGSTISSTTFNNLTTDLANALTGSIAKDGQTIPSANLPMGGFKHTGAADGSALTDYATIKQLQNSYGTWCGTAGGTANAITLTPTPSIGAYVAGQSFAFKAGASTNSGAVTFAISGLSTIAGQVNGLACIGKEIEAGKFYSITLSDTSTAQISKIGAPSKIYDCAVGGGTADAITATFNPAITALPSASDGFLTVCVRATAANATTTPTFTPNSGTVTAKTIVKGAGNALAAGDIPGAGYWMMLQYDSTLDKWVLQNPYIVIPTITVPVTNDSTSVANSTNQSIPHNTTTILSFDTEDWDDLNVHSNSVNNSRLTIATAGKYQASTFVDFNTTSNGGKLVQILKNATPVARNTNPNVSNLVDDCLNVSAILNLAVGDYVEVSVQQNTGASVSLNKDLTRFQLVRLA